MWLLRLHVALTQTSSLTRAGLEESIPEAGQGTVLSLGSVKAYSYVPLPSGTQHWWNWPLFVRTSRGVNLIDEWKSQNDNALVGLLMQQRVSQHELRSKEMTQSIDTNPKLAFLPHSYRETVFPHRVCAEDYTNKFRIESAKGKLRQLKRIFPDRNTLCIL